MAAPAAAGAATASVEPFREPPETDPFGSCGRYMMCPPDMVVFTAAAGESNNVVIAETALEGTRTRYVVRDRWSPVTPGPGCERVDDQAVACMAGSVGPQQLGDGNDRISSPGGQAFGGDGDDVLSLDLGGASLTIVDGGDGNDVLNGERGVGGAGDDLLVGQDGAGGDGDDVLVVGSGRGDAGDDVLRCPAPLQCTFRGGAGADALFGNAAPNFLFGGGGCDLLRGHDGDDELAGGAGGDRLLDIGGRDMLRGGGGADLLEDRGRRALTDTVDCGAGRRDRAIVDRRDVVIRCERLTLRRRPR
jgi:hypothetical protein